MKTFGAILQLNQNKIIAIKNLFQPHPKYSISIYNCGLSIGQNHNFETYSLITPIIHIYPGRYKNTTLQEIITMEKLERKINSTIYHFSCLQVLNYQCYIFYLFFLIHQKELIVPWLTFYSLMFTLLNIATTLNSQIGLNIIIN